MPPFVIAKLSVPVVNVSTKENEDRHSKLAAPANSNSTEVAPLKVAVIEPPEPAPNVMQLK